MPKDIKGEFLTTEKVLRNHRETGEHHQRDDGQRRTPVPMDLGNVGTHDAKMAQSDSDMSNDTSYDDVCAIAWKAYTASKATGEKGPNAPMVWHRGKGADEGLQGQT